MFMENSPILHRKNMNIGMFLFAFFFFVFFFLLAENYTQLSVRSHVSTFQLTAFDWVPNFFPRRTERCWVKTPTHIFRVKKNNTSAVEEICVQGQIYSNRNCVWMFSVSGIEMNANFVGLSKFVFDEWWI